ncbi:Rv1733c family protein [Streptomyces sp. 7R007]
MTATRWWRLRRSPLRRTSYLVEAWLLPAAWLLALAAAVVAGVLTARTVQHSSDALRSQRHAVPAVLTQDAQRTTSSVDGDGGDRAWARVRWTLPDGTTRTGVARVDAGGRAGSTTRVWLDRQGRLVPQPASAGQAQMQSLVLGTVAAVSAGSVVLLAGWGVCSLLERRRLAAWDTEWALVSPGWRGKTG